MGPVESAAGATLGGWFREDPVFVLTAGVGVLAAVTGWVVLAFLLSRREPSVKGRAWVPGALALVLAAGMLSYFAPGALLTGDGLSHLTRTWFSMDLLSHGRAPIWNLQWYCGFPMDLYYGPLYYLLSGLMSFLSGGDVFLGSKLLLWSLHLLSGAGAFLLARKILREDLAALFAAAVYALSYQHLGTVLDSGALPLGLVFALLPFLFLPLEKVRAGEWSTLGGGAAAGGVLSLVLLSHAQYGLFAGLSFFILVLVRERGSSRGWAFLGAAGGSAAGLASWFLLPLVFERRWLLLGAESRGAYLFEWGRWNLPNLRDAFFHLLWQRDWLDWTDKAVWYDWSWKYLGVSGVALALLGGWGGGTRLRRGFPLRQGFGGQDGGRVCGQEGKGPDRAGYLALFLLGLPLMIAAKRFASIWLLALAVMAGFGALRARRLAEMVPSRSRFYMVCLMVLLVLDVGLLQLQRPYDPVERNHLGSFEPGLLQEGLAGRVAVVLSTDQTLWQANDVLGTRVSTPFGEIPQLATRVYPQAAALACRAALEVLDGKGSLGDLTADGFRVFNVRWVVFPERKTVVGVDGAAPAFFAPRLLPVEPSPRLEALDWATLGSGFNERSLDHGWMAGTVKEMGLHPLKPLAQAIPVGVLPPGVSLSAPDGGGPETSFTVQRAGETASGAWFEYRSGGDGWAQASWAWWPYNRVLVDGHPVDGFPSAFHLTVFRAPAGVHRVEIRAGISPLRRVLLGLAGLTLLGPLVLRGIRRRTLARGKDL